MRRKFVIREIKKRFECQRCNLCCRAPGFVFLSAGESERIAGYLKMTVEAFEEAYCDYHESNLVLKQHADNACVFLDEKGCQIHAVKPQQCLDFPRKWRDKDAFDYCEGIQKIKREVTQKPV